MNRPQVSILVPVYNAEKFLRECLDSIINQTYRNLQIVLINDGSTDTSWEIMKEYAGKDSRIEIYNQDNRGVAQTRKNLLDKAIGNFVLFVDSDDWIKLNTIEFVMAEQAKGDYDMVSFATVDSTDKSDYVYSQSDAIREFLYHRKFNGSLWNKATRRALFDGLSFDPSISYGEDALMTWQILQRVNKVRFTSMPFYHYRMNDNSISHQSFSFKKFSAYYVWEQICSDVDNSEWAKYSDIAHGRYAIEMTLLLLSAAKSSIKKDSSIRKLQQIVKRDGKYISLINRDSPKMRLFSLLASWSFPATKFISKFI